MNYHEELSLGINRNYMELLRVTMNYYESEGNIRNSSGSGDTTSGPRALVIEASLGIERKL